MRLIDADARMEDIENSHCVDCSKYGDEKKCKKCWVTDAMWALKHAPTEDAAPVVHGRWIERPLDNFRKYEVKCSECGFIGIGNYDQYLEPIDFNYCPNCGAKMDLEDYHEQ